MKKSLFSVLLLGFSATLAHSDITVKPAGMQIVWDDGGETFDGFKTFNSKPGVNLVFHLTTDKGKLIGVDTEKSKVQVGGAESYCSFYDSSSSRSKDGKTIKLELNTEGAQPTEGKFKTSGEIVVSTANGSAELSSSDIEWKKGSKVQFPEQANLPIFEIDKIGKPSWGDDKWEVTLKTNKKFDKFVSVKFIDENGKEHKATRGSWSSMSMFGKSSVTVSYKAPVKITKAKMVVEVWQNLNTTTVPFNFTFGTSGAE